jgi:hypothetical protein
MPRSATYSAFRRLALLAFIAAGVIACESPTEGPGTAPPGQAPVASIEITMPASELVVGQSVVLQARLRAADGAILERAVVWSSSDTAVATVSAAGVLTARAGGSVRITARSEARQASITIGIRQPATVTSIDILGPGADLVIGQTFPLSATVRGANGSVLDVPVTWSSSDAAVAAVSASGLLTARAAGSIQVTAAAGGQQATLQVMVRSVPATATELLPASVQAGSPGFELKIRGTGFQPGATVRWAGQERPARVISPTEARVDITAADVQHAGAAEVRVLNPGQTLSAALFFVIERVPRTRVYDLLGVAWGESGLPVEVGSLYLGGDIRQSAAQQVTAGVLRIHERAYGPEQWDLTITMVTTLRATGEIWKQEDIVFSGNVEYASPEGHMRLRSGMFPAVVLQTVTTHDGDVVVWQSLHYTGAPAEEKPWRYTPR